MLESTISIAIDIQCKKSQSLKKMHMAFPKMSCFRMHASVSYMRVQMECRRCTVDVIPSPLLVDVAQGWMNVS